jgi:hypothetical protein
MSSAVFLIAAVIAAGFFIWLLTVAHKTAQYRREKKSQHQQFCNFVRDQFQFLVDKGGSFLFAERADRGGWPYFRLRYRCFELEMVLHMGYWEVTCHRLMNNAETADEEAGDRRTSWPLHSLIEFFEGITPADIVKRIRTQGDSQPGPVSGHERVVQSAEIVSDYLSELEAFFDESTHARRAETYDLWSQQSHPEVRKHLRERYPHVFGDT